MVRTPYVGCEHACKYCYADAMQRRFSGHAEPWGEYVDVKLWTPIWNPYKYEGNHITIGTVTDPYQPCEATYMRTYQLLTEIKDINARVMITTKSKLVLRDIELLKQFKNLQVSISLNTLDEKFRSDMDKGSTVTERIETMRELHVAGISVACFSSPVFPGLTNARAIYSAVHEYVDQLGFQLLRTRGDKKNDLYMYYQSNYPEYLQLFYDTFWMGDPSFWSSFVSDLQSLANEKGLLYRTYKKIGKCKTPGKPDILVI